GELAMREIARTRLLDPRRYEPEPEREDVEQEGQRNENAQFDEHQGPTGNCGSSRDRERTRGKSSQRRTGEEEKGGAIPNPRNHDGNSGPGVIFHRLRGRADTTMVGIGKWI